MNRSGRCENPDHFPAHKEIQPRNELFITIFNRTAHKVSCSARRKRAAEAINAGRAGFAAKRSLSTYRFYDSIKFPGSTALQQNTVTPRRYQDLSHAVRQSATRRCQCRSSIAKRLTWLSRRLPSKHHATRQHFLLKLEWMVTRDLMRSAVTQIFPIPLCNAEASLSTEKLHNQVS